MLHLTRGGLPHSPPCILILPSAFFVADDLSLSPIIPPPCYLPLTTSLFLSQISLPHLSFPLGLVPPSLLPLSILSLRHGLPLSLFAVVCLFLSAAVCLSVCLSLSADLPLSLSAAALLPWQLGLLI